MTTMKVSVYICFALLLLGSHGGVEATGLDQEEYTSQTETGDQAVLQEGSEESTKSKEDWFWNPFAAKKEAEAEDGSDGALKDKVGEREDTKITQEEDEVVKAEAQGEAEDEVRELDGSDGEAREGDKSEDADGEGNESETQEEAEEEDETESLDETDEAEETDDDSKLEDEDDLGHNGSVELKDDFQSYLEKGKNCKNGERRGLGCYSSSCKIIGGGKCKGLCCQSQLKKKGNKCKKDGPAPCWGMGPKSSSGKGKKGKGKKSSVMCMCSSPNDPADTSFECDNGKSSDCGTKLCSEDDEFKEIDKTKTCKACVPYSEVACKIAADAQCLSLGGGGFDFAGKYGTKGCYTYSSGKYKGMAFYGTGGSTKDMKKDAKSPKTRIKGDDCGKVQAQNCAGNKGSPTTAPTQARPQKPLVNPTRPPSRPPLVNPTRPPSGPLGTLKKLPLKSQGCKAAGCKDLTLEQCHADATIKTLLGKLVDKKDKFTFDSKSYLLGCYHVPHKGRVGFSKGTKSDKNAKYYEKAEYFCMCAGNKASPTQPPLRPLGTRPPVGTRPPQVRPTPQAAPAKLGVDFGAAWIEGANCSNELGGVGTTATLDEFGYLEVAEICCNFQMEFYITRVVIAMGYKVCDQSGVMGLVPWFSCGDFQSLTKLKLAIQAGAPSETECPFIQWNNDDCVALATKCFSNETKNDGYHRRRVCDKVGGYSGGSPGGQQVSIDNYALYAPAPSPSGGGRGKNSVYNLGGPARYGGTNFNTINVPGYAGFDFGGYTPLAAPSPPPQTCAATFMNMGGTTVMNTIVQGETDYALDVACCNKCTAEKDCTFWVRKSGVAPGTACYLRKKAAGISNSLAYRGGWRRELMCGAKNGCFSSFDYMSGTIVEKVGICGDSPDALDQHCCEKCKKNEDCEFWVREAGDSGYRGCQLMKNPGSKSKNILWRGGWKQGCGKNDDCHATFMNRGGSLLDKLGVCGEGHIQLDAGCCELCSQNEDCEFWVRETGSSGSQFCWIYKNAAMAESYSSNRRGGWSKICNDGNGYDQCLASFQNINGATVQTTRVCGKSDAGLDTECCQKCKKNNLCESWVRERGSRGYKTCILKRASTTESAHANYRGGYTTKQSCGDAYLDQGCRASFYDWGGPQVGKVRYVCGKNAAELDAHCCALCRNETTCTFWVRESIGSTVGEGANRPRACWLRRAMGGPSKNLNRRGGFKQGCGKGVTSCKQTFMDRSGAQVDRVAVCATNTFKTMTQRDQYLDGACCDLCAKNPLCEFWVRDRIPFTNAHGAPNTTYCWLRKNAAINPSNNANRRGGWNRICGNPKFTPCAASFQELHGHVVATHRVCGRSDEQLDAECCSKCKDMKTCDFWVREKGSNGYLWCWLRRKGNGNKSPNANRRGGYKTPMTCGKQFLRNGCKSTFDEMSGSQLKIEFVCGATDLEMDAHCCALCRNDTRCEFWVRETRLVTDAPTRPKMCWLRWNAGSASKNANRRGGWREGCDNKYPNKCKSTFTDRSGPEVDKRGVCGNGTKAIAMDEYLDSACCDLCAKNPLCEFWVRETVLPAANNTFCYLRKHGAVAETVRTNKRGGWNRICGNPNNPACGAVFQEIHSSHVAQFRVCGRSDAALDAECCSKCKDNNLCEKWVRETGSEGWRWCWLRRAGNNQLRAHGSRRGGWKESGKCGDAYVSNGCKSSFDHIGGSQVGYTFICGKNEDELDAHCCAACRNNTRCEFWVRQSGKSGIKQCWLRMNPGGHSKNAGYRGGWKQGCAGDGTKKCDATFTDWNGGTVDQLGVCGEDDAKMDAACCALCDQNKDCEFWVREDTEKVTADRKNSALCWLKKTGSTERVATDRRGAWKACASQTSGDCPATFQEMSGPQVAVSRVCGDDEAKLDAACCANCAKNPSCMFWVRESGEAGYRYCWLRRNPGGASNNNNRRGGFKARNFQKCDGTFGDMSGPQVGAMTVYGGSDAELDAECCNYCRKQSNCEFWVRDYRRTFPSNIGGKTCWLRRAPNFNSRSATHPHRRGGMKPKSLLQEDAQEGDVESEADMNMKEDGQDAPDAQDPELNLLQSSERSQSSRLWTIGDASAKVDEHQEQQQTENEAKAQAAAEAKAQTEERELEQAERAAEFKIADEQTAKATQEEKLKDFNLDISSRVHESGHRAALDERGYKAVANLKNNAEMEAFIRRACQYMGFAVKDEAKLQGIVPYYSGVAAKQSFESLLLELERNAHDAAVDHEKWLLPEGEAALEFEPEAAPASLEAES